MNGTAESLLRLRDVHAPSLPDAWPPAPGWWFLAGLVVISAILIGQAVLRHRRDRRQKRAIVDVLRALRTEFAADADGARFAAEISMLLRRIALTRFPRTEVASLCGAAWLSFLDNTSGGVGFSEGPGQVLAAGPYAADVEVEAEALLALAIDWIDKNTVNRHER